MAAVNPAKIDSTAKLLRGWESGDFLAVTKGGTGLSTVAANALLYASAADTIAALAAGSTGDVLTVAGGVPTWAAPAVDITGTPAANQLATWSDANTLQGGAAALSVAGALSGVTTCAMSSHIVQSSDAYGMVSDTADGSDTKRIRIAGGGSNSTTRGAFLEVCGNEHATTPGALAIIAGNVTGAKVRMLTADTERLVINHDGTVTVHATTAASLVGTTGPGIAALTAKTTPVAGDDFLIADSAASDVAKRVSFSDLQTALGGASFVGCAVYKNADQAGLTAQTWTAITWPAEVFDSGTMHDNVTNNSRITIPTTGKYLFVVNIGQISVSTNLNLKLYVNGTKRETAGVTGSYGYYSLFLSSVLDLTAGDYVQAYVSMHVGGDIQYDVNTTASTFYLNAVASLSCVKVG